MTNGFLSASTVEMLRKKGISPDCVENFFSEEGIITSDNNQRCAANIVVSSIINIPGNIIFCDDKKLLSYKMFQAGIKKVILRQVFFECSDTITLTPTAI